MTASEPWKASVYWRLPVHLQALRRLMRVLQPGGGRTELIRIAEAASDLSDRHPLHMVSKKFEIKCYADDLTGAGVTAILIASIWILCGEDARVASAMVTDWPDLPMFAKVAG